MSIATMVRNDTVRRTQRDANGSGRHRAGLPPVDAEGHTIAPPSEAATATSTLAAYVPTEAIAAYLVLLPFVDPSLDLRFAGVARAHRGGFGGRWWLTVGIGLLAIGYALGYQLLATRKARQSFSVPWLSLIVTEAAFVAWVFTIPGSPFDSFGFYTPQLGGAVGVIAAAGISFVGMLTDRARTYAAEPAAT